MPNPEKGNSYHLQVIPSNIRNVIVGIVKSIIIVYVIAMAFWIIEKVFPDMSLINSVYNIYFDSELSTALFTAVLLLAAVTAVVIHEFGHLVLGIFSGFKFESFGVGPLHIKFVNGKLKSSINSNSPGDGFVELSCLNEPSNSQFLLVTAGGAIFGFVFGVFFHYLAFIALKDTGFEALNLFLRTSAFMNTGASIFNLLPIRLSGGVTNDGYILFSILLKKPFAFKIKLVMFQFSQLNRNVRPGELDISYEPDMEEFTFVDYHLFMNRYHKALDNQDLEKVNTMGKTLQEKLEKFPPTILEDGYKELCFISCILNDLAGARNYYKKVESALQKDISASAHRIKAYFEFHVNQDMDKAMEHCDKIENYSGPDISQGLLVMEKDLAKKLRLGQRAIL